MPVTVVLAVVVVAAVVLLLFFTRPKISAPPAGEAPGPGGRESGPGPGRRAPFRVSPELLSAEGDFDIESVNENAISRRRGVVGDIIN